MGSSTSSSRAMLSLVLALVFCWGAISSAPVADAISPGEKHLEFTFYFHGSLLSKTNATSFIIVQPLEVPDTSPTAVNQSYFGAVVVFDDSLTTEISESSLEIGRGRGIYAFDANDTRGAGLEFLWTAEFNAASGYGEGSTLSYKGFDRTTGSAREISIVGGTGTFRLARGWAIITTAGTDGVEANNLKFVSNVFYGY